MDIYDFGLRLKELRESRNLSQNKLAEMLEVDRTTISSYECDRIAPSALIVKKVALHFNVTADYLLGLTDAETISLSGFSEGEKQAITRIVDEIKSIANGNKIGD